MKRLVLAFTAAVACAISAHASIILSNSFGYANGPLVSGSVGSPLGVWTTHSGTANQVDVLDGVVNLTGLEGEDVSTVLTNTAFPTAISNGTIYASFDVNFSQAPIANVYFAHFRGIGTGDFRCRVFAGASSPAGQVRIGIVNGSSTAAAFTPILLNLGTTYKIVVRFVNAGAATVWVNPSFESNTGNRADGTDTASNTYGGAYYWSWRQANDMGTMTVDNLLVGTTFREVAIPPGAPVISAIPDQIIPANTSTGPLAFQVDDLETPGNLTPSGYSEDTTLIPNANITFGGSGANRTVSIAPAAGKQGATRVGVVVTDGNSLSSTTMVNVIVGRPTISTVPNQVTRVGTPFPTVNFTVNDTETPNSLSVVGYSSNQGLITDAGLQVSGAGTSRTLQIVPVPGQTGAATIDLVVSDAFQSATNRFLAAVSPSLGVLVSDDFSYTDSTLPEASGYYWLSYSSQLSNDLVVASQKVLLTYSNYMDCHAYFSNSVTLGASSGAMLYSKLIVNQKETPRGSGGNYFAYFKESGSSQFRARIFTQTNGAAPGKFRLAISNGAFTQQAFPQDLSTNVDYTVITKYDTVNNLATLWVNPASEQSPSISGIDFTTGTDLMTYALRQDSSLGVLTVDDLRVGTAWSDVYSASQPFPASLNIQKNANGSVTLTWTDSRYRLQWSANPASGWADVAGAVSGYTEAATGTKYFRLINP